MSYCKITKKFVPLSEMKLVYTIHGQKMMVAPDVKTHKCKGCGKDIYLNPREHYHLDENLDVICFDCRERATWHICHTCRNWFKDSDLQEYEMEDGEFVFYCEEHRSNANTDLVQCDECERFIWRGDEHEIDGCNYCSDCHRELFRECAVCGAEFKHSQEGTLTEDGYWLCDQHRSYAEECIECHRLFYDIDNMTETEEDSEEYLCRNCAENNTPIHNYSYKPQPKFNKMPDENNVVEYEGYEIEVAGNPLLARQFLEVVGDLYEDIIYLKRDCSIGHGSGYGFEIVTHPMTRRFFMEKFMPALSRGMEYLKRNGFKGHNNGGIHIHVSQPVITHDMFSKMFQMMYQKSPKNYKLWLAITQRKGEEMGRWSSMSLNSIINSSKKDVLARIKRAKQAKCYKKADISYSRYIAINTNNENTVEFRIFNSSLREERIIKNAQVIFALIDFTKSKRKVSMKNFLKFIEDNRKQYKELYDFLIEKHIYIPELSMERLLELSNDENSEEMQKYIASLNAEQNLTVDENDEEIA